MPMGQPKLVSSHLFFQFGPSQDWIALEETQEDLDNPDMAVFGYQEGASVGLGLVKDDREISGYRYLIPSCWGLVSLRLDLEDQNFREQANTTWKQWVDAMKQDLQMRANPSTK